MKISRFAVIRAIVQSRVVTVYRTNITLTINVLIPTGVARWIHKRPPDKAIPAVWSWGDLERLHPAYKRRKRVFILASIAILPALMTFAWWGGRGGLRISGDTVESLTPIAATFTASDTTPTNIQVPSTQPPQLLAEPTQLVATPTPILNRQIIEPMTSK